jgi:arsenate reductase (glutaredoxin)
MSTNTPPLVLCYPKCGTCQKAEKWLKANEIEYAYRPIKEQNPSVDELKLWIELSGLPVSKFFNTSGLLYKEQNMKDKVKVLSTPELIEILASNGLMVKRPILVAEGKVLVGFKEEAWMQQFEK